MAELKTKKTAASVDSFLDAIPDEDRREDCRTVLKIMQDATGAEPAMWGNGIVGFGHCRYTNSSGDGTDWFLTGFSPRKQNLTLYLLCGTEWESALLEKLGKHKTGKSCLYIKKLDDVHLPTLKTLVKKTVKQIRKMFPEE